MTKLIRIALFAFLGVFLSAAGFDYSTFEFWVILVTAILIQITAMLEKTYD